MRYLRRIFLRFYQLFTNSKVEADLAREIAAHLALLEDEYVRQGMSASDERAYPEHCLECCRPLSGNPDERLGDWTTLEDKQRRTYEFAGDA